MLKILQARLQWYVNYKLPGVQTVFRKGRRIRDQIAYLCWILEKAKEFQKNTYFCFIDYAKAFDCVDPSKLWKNLKEMGIPDHLTCRLRNLCAVKKKQNWIWNNSLVPNWERIHQDCILSPWLFNLYADYIMQNARLYEAQAGIKIAVRPKIRNKTRVPTLTTSIQHSFGSVGHSNQGRKRGKRKPNRKRRSKTLTVCR